MRHQRKLFLCLGVVAAGVAAVWWCNAKVAAQAAHTFDDAAKVPHMRVGLVLGCSPTGRDGGPNPFYTGRMKAAETLYRAGKIDFILVSGDNRHKSYDEPASMKKSLIKLGVPENKIVCDHAGFTTLDSVVRCKEVFGQTSVIIISQKFHNERAIYIARAHGMDAKGFNAEAVSVQRGLRTYLRESAARVRAVWDVNISGRRPEILGEAIKIGEEGKSKKA